MTFLITKQVEDQKQYIHSSNQQTVLQKKQFAAAFSATSDVKNNFQ